MNLKNILKYAIPAIIIGLLGWGIVAAAPCVVNSGCTGNSHVPKATLLVGSSTDQSLTKLSVGSDGQVLVASSTAFSGLAWGSAGAASAGGSNTQIQYNNSNSLAGSGNFTWINASSLVVLNGTLNASTTVVTNASSTNQSITGLSNTFLAVNSVGLVIATTTPQLQGNYITALTGDGTASGPGSVALTLATVNTNTGSWGSTTQIPSFTVNGKGLITAAANNTPSLPASDITSGQLAIANGGTGTSTPGLIQGSNITITGTWPFQTIAAAGTNYNVISANNLLSVSTTTNLATLTANESPSFTGTLNVTGTSTLATTTITNLSTTLPPTFGGLGGAGIVQTNLLGTLSRLLAINLVTQVTGVLQPANGGSGTSTVPTVTGQLMAADSTGTIYSPTNLVAGSNITITTTTPGQITIASSAGGGSGTISTSTNALIGHVANWTGLATLGNGAWLDNGTVVGFNATSSTIGVNIQGTGGTNDILNIASSSGTSMLRVSANNNILLQNETTPTLSNQKFFEVLGSQSGGIARFIRDAGNGILGSTNYGTQDVALYSATSTIDFPDLSGPIQTFSIATGTMQNQIGSIGAIREGNDTTGGFQILAVQNGANSAQIEANGSTAYASIFMQATPGATAALALASSSAVDLLVVQGNGNVGIGSATPASNLVIQGSSGQANPTLFTIASSTGALITAGINANGLQFGINTTTGASIVNIVGNASNSTFSLINIASSTGTSYFMIDQFGHQWTGGPSPTCGAGCASVTGDDNNFRAVTGSGVTAVTINFANTWKNPLNGTIISPICTGSDESGGTTTSDPSSTPTSVTVNLSASLTSKNLAIQCRGSLNLTQ